MVRTGSENPTLPGSAAPRSDPAGTSMGRGDPAAGTLTEHGRTDAATTTTAGERAPTATATAGRRRIAGIDVARAIAIIGMIVVNTGAKDLDAAPGPIWAMAHGRASLLFVLLAGVGVSLLTRRRRRLDGPGRRALLWRAGVLLALGLVLSVLDHGAQVILPTYALLFVLAVGLVRVPTRWLVVGACTLAAAGPVAILLNQQRLGEEYSRQASVLDGGPADAAQWLVLTGGYPLVTWLAPFLLGMALGRIDLGDRRVQHRLIVVGGGVAAIAWVTSRLLLARFGEPDTLAGLDHLVVDAAHSQMPLWLIGGTGAAVLMLGLAILADGLLGRFLWPFVATGQLALTIYVGHLVVLHLVPDASHVHVGVAIPLPVLLSVAAVGLAVAWRTFARYGPLEMLMRIPR